MPTIFKPKRDYKKEPSFGARKDRMKIYNSKKWQDLRTAKQMEQPLCIVCELEGKTTLGTDVHHLVSPFKFEGTEREAIAYDYNQLVNLCDHHHWAIHHSWLYGVSTMEELEARVKEHIEQETENQEK